MAQFFLQHLVVDLFECDKGKFTVDDCVELIHIISFFTDVKTVGKPLINETADKLEFAQIIAESHIKILCYKQERVVLFDFFSCKEFDSHNITLLLILIFQPARIVVDHLPWRLPDESNQ